jgi:hypothetical protein
MTRHWVEANVNEYGPGFVLYCEHPRACGETSPDARDVGCAAKDWFDDVGAELFEVGKGETVSFGRVQVSCRWRGSGPDAELALIPIPTSPAVAPAGSRRPEPTAGDLVDWKAIAIKIGQRWSDWQLLSTSEAEALRVEVDAVWDREAIAEDTRQVRMSDEARGGE